MQRESEVHTRMMMHFGVQLTALYASRTLKIKMKKKIMNARACNRDCLLINCVEVNFSLVIDLRTPRDQLSFFLQNKPMTIIKCCACFALFCNT